MASVAHARRRGVCRRWCVWLCGSAMGPSFCCTWGTGPSVWGWGARAGRQHNAWGWVGGCHVGVGVWWRAGSVGQAWCSGSLPGCSQEPSAPTWLDRGGPAVRSIRARFLSRFSGPRRVGGLGAQGALSRLGRDLAQGRPASCWVGSFCCGDYPPGASRFGSLRQAVSGCVAMVAVGILVVRARGVTAAPKAVRAV